MTRALEAAVAPPGLTVELLGPLRVTRGDAPVEVRGGRLRALLVQLALQARRPVSGAVLVDALWPDSPPADAANALQSLVSRLRAALGDGSLVRQVDGGYLLDVAPGDVDALRFEVLGREPGRAAEALALWRGPLPPEVPAVRLEELRLGLIGSRIEADLAAGLDVTAELTDLVRRHPLREDLAARLVRALSQQGRQAEALQEFEAVKQRLADELGADPSSDLLAAHLEVLRRRPEAPRNNLRASLTSFVGRAAELAEIAARLGAHRLVTVVGPGGAGKTRLATEAAARTPGSGGTWLVELAPVQDPDDVPAAVLTAIGLRETALLDRRVAPRETTVRLVDALGGPGVLLVLDNAEHLLDPVAELAETLLGSCPGLRVLVTSREALGIAGESLVPLAPLDVPAAGSSPLEALAHPSVALFADRAAAVRPGFAVDSATVDEVVELVRRLDGLPLALELAAARLRSLPLREVVGRLDDRFRLLTGGSRTALPRHRTLRAVVAWSWELLGKDERRLADRASVFPGGLTAASAAAVVEQAGVADLLAALVDKSLLQLVDGGAAPRYRMLETLREYGAERLAETGELVAVRRSHAQWFAALAARAEPELRAADQLHWLAVLHDERDNLLAALRCLTDLGETDAALVLGLDLGWYWLMMGRHAEAAAHLGPALALPPGGDAVTRLGAQVVATLHEQAAAGFGGAAGPPDEALQELAQGLQECDVTGRPLLVLLGAGVLYLTHDPAGSARLLERAVAGDDPWLSAAARSFRARFHENDGDIDAVRADLEPAVAAFRDLGDRWGLVTSLPLAALLRQYDGDLDGAARLLEEAAELGAQLGSNDLVDQAFIGLRLVDVHLRRGRPADAEAVMAATAELTRSDRASDAKAFLDALHGSMLRQLGDLEGAARLQALAEAALPGLEVGLQQAPHGVAVVMGAGAELALATGDLEGARMRLTGAYEAGVLSHDSPIAALVAVCVAQLALALDRPELAAELLGAAARLRGAHDPTAPQVRAVREGAQAQLGPAPYAVAYDAGWSLDRADALVRTDPVRLPTGP